MANHDVFASGVSSCQTKNYTIASGENAVTNEKNTKPPPAGRAWSVIKAKWRLGKPDNEAREGDTVVNQAIDQIERLAVEVGRSTEAMAVLQQESDKIGSVMDVIKAVASALRDGGYRNGLIVARNEATGAALAASCGYEWQPELGAQRPQMLINVTPVGMTGGAEADDLAFEADAIDRADILFDVVAIPVETPLIVRGRAQGKQVITGLEVIAIQALEQFVLYPGVRPTAEQFQAAVAFARS